MARYRLNMLTGPSSGQIVGKLLGRWQYWLGVGLLASFGGCQDQSQISRYQVPHEPAAAVAASPSGGAAANGAPGESGASPSETTAQRMLGGIIQAGTQAWFFKVTGAPDQVEPLVQPLQEFLRTVQIAADAAPQWTLPEGWTAEGGNGMRFATLRAGGAEGSSHEISVISLPITPGQDWNAYLLANLNRWRGQVQLPEIGPAELATSVTTLESDHGNVVWVDLLGSGSGAAPPMMAQRSPGAANPATPPPAAPPTTPPAGAAGAATGSSSGLTYDLPEGWEPGRAGGMRLAAFQIEQDGLTAELTIIALGPAAGSVLDNVNRWRGQIQWEPMNEAQLAEQIQPLQVSGHEGQLIELLDEARGDQAILAVIVPQSGQTLFIKLMGPSKIVAAERERFRQFVGSLQLPASP